ncbi:MAG: protein kinase [Phycisphaeraceae bacterium]|nr:MAG: protein kinase [Phycisphaeraceae bacterium]
MPGEPSREIEALFGEAADLPFEAREAFLRERCPEPAVRQRVEELLRHDLEAGETFLSGARRDAPGVGVGPVAVPERIGGYRIVRLIGEGGMGLVYEARQDHPDRAVALKVIRPGMISRPALRRFEAEAEVLGRLSHPGIASIYEAGRFETPDGPRPFIAMELVRGEPLDRYCRTRGLSVRRRAEMMVRVCEAVHHAHTRGVIHRDLKPGNILVDDAGEPRVLDFGIARLVREGAETGLGSLMTHAGQMLGTLPYMSPEQVGGDPAAVDARTDVYALGVILYELLAGRTPINLENLPLPEAARRIREDEPRRLVSVSRTFAGDLDTITGRALAKEPHRRYASASELAEDLRRHLGDEPIRARPTGTFEQIRKFARRNPGLAVGVAASMLILVAGVVAVSILAAREHDARLEAEGLKDQAERNAYRASLAAALGAIRASAGPGAAVRVLEEVPEARRGWEWRFVRRWADPSFERYPRGSFTLPDDRGATHRFEPGVGHTFTDQATGERIASWAPSAPDRRSINPLRNGLGALVYGPSGFERRDPETGRLEWSDPVGSSEPTWVTVARDGETFAYALERESRVVVRRGETGSVIADLPCPDPIATVFSPDGLILAAGKNIFDVETASLIRRTDGYIQDFSIDRNYAIEVRPGPGRSHELAVVGVRDGVTHTTIPISYADTWMTPAAVFTDTESTMLVGEQPMKVQSYHVWTGARLGPGLAGFGAPLDRFAGRPGTVGVSVAGSRDWALIPEVMPSAYAVHIHDGQHASAAISPSTAFVARGDWCTVSAWDTRTGRVEWRRSVGTHEVRVLAVAPDESWVATDAGRGKVALFHLLNGTPGTVLSIPGLEQPVTAMAWKDPFTLAAGYADGTLVEWKAHDGSHTVMPAMSGRVFALAYAPNVARLAAASSGEGGTARLALIDTGERRNLARDTGPHGDISALVFGSGGESLAVAAGDAVHIYRVDVDTRVGRLTPAGTLLGATSAITALSWHFEREFSRVLAGTRDGQVLIWDRLEGEQRELCAIATGHEMVLGVALDGERRLVASAREATVAWELAPIPGTHVPRRSVTASAMQAFLRLDRENRTTDDLRRDVAADPRISDDLRAEVIGMLARLGDNAARLNSSAWSIVVRPDRAPGSHERAVVLAEAADRALPGHWAILNTLGYAYLRAGRHEEAIRAFMDSESAGAGVGRANQAVNWAPMAIAQHRLGRGGEAAASLERALALAGTPGQDDPETMNLVDEARAVIGSGRGP